jgi:1,4-alpha-glucan branching enzyme
MSAIEQLAQTGVESRSARCAPDRPISIYQVHPPSWMQVPEQQNRSLTCPEIAPKLADHVNHIGFTHVQLHLDADTDPKELESLIGYLHQRGLDVILEGRAFVNAAADGQYLDGQAVMSDYTYKWDTRWAEETCIYFGVDPLQRKSCREQFMRRDNYAFGANYILPLSEDLVRRPRQSLLAMMPGDIWRKFATLRLLFACQYLSPGKKLVFMGDEFGQENPWRPETSLDWHLVNDTNFHGKLLAYVAALNRLYRAERALHETDSGASGFEWVDTSDFASNIVSFVRRSADGREILLTLLNCTPSPRHNYRIGASRGGFWTEVLNSDALEFGGSGQGNLGGMEAAPFGWNLQSHSLMLTLPPLAAVVIKAPFFHV